MQKRRALRGLFLSCAAASALACTRGKSHEQKAEQARASSQVTVAPVEAPAASEDWEQGRLPASVIEGTPRSGGQLVVGITTDPPSLNVNLDSDLVASWITRHRIYEALVNIDPFDDPRYRVIPELAERWEQSADHLVYTFHLRRDVRWHDGQPFTARDVIATFDKIRDPTTKAVDTRSYFQELASYSAPDDFTVRMVWKRPYFLTLDSIADVAIQPAHVIASLTGSQYNEAATNPLNRHPVGTGPFELESWESASKIVLARNDAYWGKKPYLERVVFRIQQDPTVLLQLAERGEIDVMDHVTSDQWTRMDSRVLRTRWNRSKLYPAHYSWIGWNTRRPFFSDARTRRALTMLIDRPGIIGKLLHGLPRPTTCHFYWASASCDPQQQPLPYDPTAAQKLLDEAGFTDHDGDGVRDKAGTAFRFVLMLPVGSVEAGLWSAKVKEDLARAGIDMEIQSVEWSAFLKRLTEHNFDAATLAWGGGPRGDPTQIWHSSSIKGGSNYISYRHPELDKLQQDARVVFDDAQRDALYRRFGAILHEEQPYTFMYVRPELNLLHKKVKGARPSLMWWQFEQLWIDPDGTAPK